MKKSLLIASLLAVAAAAVARAQPLESTSSFDETAKAEDSVPARDNETLAETAD
jgi:hypothetical protein